MDDKPNGELTGKPTARAKKLAAEEVTSLLKSGAKKRRVSRAVILLYLLVLSAIPLGFFLWWFWPQPAPPPMLLVAFDQLCVGGEEVSLRAQLVPKQNADAPDARLEGWPMLFREMPAAPTPGQVPWQGKTRSDASGGAAATWKAPDAQKMLSFAVRYAPESKDNTAEDRGWVYCLPVDARLLIVDVEHTLAQAKLADWGRKQTQEIPAQPEATKALAAVLQTKKMHPVYLACAVAELGSYRKVRAWVQSVLLQAGMPLGPVLREGKHARQQDAKMQVVQTAQAVREKFKGKVIAVTTDADTAAAFHDGGLPTYLIGDAGEARQGVTILKDWSQLAEKLPGE